MEPIYELIKKLLNRYWRLLAIVALAFVAGYLIAPTGTDSARISTKSQPVTEAGHSHDPAEASVPTVWTCSMHPQIRLPNPGKCPICFMDLIPGDSSKAGSTDSESRQISMSQAAAKLAQIQTSPVVRDFAKFKISMIGMVFEDETRVAALTARVEGRLDDVYVNFTGVQVNKGDPMVKIWSPPLIRAQVELFETLKGSDPKDDVVRGAEEKLIQLGLTRDQVEEIKNNKKPMINITLRAPINGIVTRKNAVLGQFVREGQEMFIINDLSRVWVKLDAYETDIPWIRYGQEVHFKASAVPGKVFKGKVLFIDPVLDTKTRSVKVRVEADNPDFLLKPGMFVNAQLEAELDNEVRVIKSEWSGKYICPIHPRDTASDTPGNCPESNMPMRPASAFGYSDNPNPTPPLLVPATAPLITGKRAIVFVERKDTASPTYDLREVSLGPRAGSSYIVLSGLSEGERVVTKGAFKLDSAMQISAKQSMMSETGHTKEPQIPVKAEEELIERIKVGDQFRKDLNVVIGNYIRFKDALVDEKTDDAVQESRLLLESLDHISFEKESQQAKDYFRKYSSEISKSLAKIDSTTGIAEIRRSFETTSESLSRIVMSFGHSLDSDLKLYHCPMAFDGAGAYWLESSAEKSNPYFGRKPHKGQDMLKCGELQETIASSVPTGPVPDAGVQQ